MTKMHEASEKLFNSTKDRRSHRTPQGGGRSDQARGHNHESPSLNASAANMSISSDVTTSSNDFTQETTTKYFFACGATQATEPVSRFSVSRRVDTPTASNGSYRLIDDEVHWVEAPTETANKQGDRFSYLSKRWIVGIGVMLLSLVFGKTRKQR